MHQTLVELHQIGGGVNQTHATERETLVRARGTVVTETQTTIGAWRRGVTLAPGVGGFSTW